MTYYISVQSRDTADIDDGLVICFYGPKGGRRGNHGLTPLDALKLRNQLGLVLDELGTKFRDSMVIASTESDALTHSTEEK